MFTYPIWGQSEPGLYSNTSYFVIGDNSANDYVVYFSLTTGGTLTEIGKYDPGGSIANNAQYVAANTTHAIVQEGTSFRRLKYNGSALVSVDTHSVGGLNVSKGILAGTPDDVVLMVGTEAFSDGGRGTPYDSESPYTLGTTYSDSNAPSGQGVLDICRTTELSQAGMGTLYVVFPQNSSSPIEVWETNGSSTFTVLGSNSTGTIGGFHNYGVDRYTGKIYMASNTSFASWTVNQSTGAITKDGTDTLYDAHAVTGCKGYVVIYEQASDATDASIRTYTESSGTLTLVDSYEIGGPGGGTNNLLMTDPYSGIVYLTCVGGVAPRAFAISDSGSVTSLGSITGIATDSAGNTQPIAFIPAPGLPTL